MVWPDTRVARVSDRLVWSPAGIAGRVRADLNVRVLGRTGEIVETVELVVDRAGRVGDAAHRGGDVDRDRRRRRSRRSAGICCDVDSMVWMISAGLRLGFNDFIERGLAGDDRRGGRGSGEEREAAAASTATVVVMRSLPGAKTCTAVGE